MQFNEIIFKEFKPLFKNRGFEEAKYFEHYGALDYYINTKESIHWVRLAFSLNNNAFVQVNSFISFPAVLDILKRFIDIKTDFIEEVVKNYYIKSEWSSLMENLCKLPLKPQAEKDVFKNSLLQHVDEYILPFFERIPSLQAVNDEILNKVQEDEYANYIPGQTNFKVLIVMKLCGNPKYEGFKNWALEAYKKGAEMNPGRYGSDYKTLQSLVKYLDSEQYKT